MAGDTAIGKPSPLRGRGFLFALVEHFGRVLTEFYIREEDERAFLSAVVSPQTKKNSLCALCVSAVKPSCMLDTESLN
ncbi:MAG: hypothetical protein CVU57_15445 [Deltaproteobacteria bacterium HGW-Deltaproteobacteria-15]|jgi:hypothetical protein|nr:MAG: hypothetical protein CVU57_15445 [Deltaproteobacteria bacterium HGW-Deltaproteobacteria-15]